mgnify:CR=1 FL=1
MSKINLINSTFLDHKKTKSELIKFIKKSNKLSMGEQCEKYEIEFSKFQKRKYTVMFNSGSSANLGLLQALKNLGFLKTNDKICFSGVTWSTNVMPIIQLGMQPIPVDVNINTLNCDSQNLIKILKIYKNIKVFFITNVLGLCSDIDNIRKICKKNKIILIEDNCESFGSEFKKIKLGNFGLASTCSSYVGHHLSTIEGGTVSTDEYDLYNMLKIVRAHGWNRNVDYKYRKKLKKNLNVDSFYDLYTFYDLGYNLRPTEINGFIGRKQLKLQSKNISTRMSNFYNLQQIMNSNKNYVSVANDKMNILSNFAFPIIKSNKKNIKNIINYFIKSNIEIRPLVAGNITKQPFFKKYVKKNYNLPISDHIHECGFYIPNHSELNNKDISYLKKVLRNI